MPTSVADRHRRLLLGTAGVLLLLGVWTVASLAGGWFIPAPWATLVDLGRLLGLGATWRQVGITALRVVLGFAAGYIVGVAAGMAIGTWRGAEALLKPAVLFFQGMPPLLWAIPVVVVLGIGHVPTILVIALITFPTVAVTVAEGMRTLPRELGEMLAIFAPGPRARLVELVIPHLGPFLGAALKVGLVLAVKASVTAEYFGANDGIGFRIQAAYQTLQVRDLFAWALVLIALILVLNHLLPRAWRLVARLARQRRPAPVVCSIDDIRELKSIFVTERISARLALEGVSFAWSRGRPVIAGADLAVGPREIAVITGDSGVGKTTLLKVAAGLLAPAAGKVVRPARIGFVFQDDRLLPWRSVVENTALPLVHAGTPRKNARCFAEYLLAEAGLPGDGEKPPAELSGGMKKRVALARCFARIPDAIILDEPFSGLHREAREALWRMLVRLLSLHPVPVIVVTHFPEEIAAHHACRVHSLAGHPATLRELPRRPRRVSRAEGGTGATRARGTPRRPRRARP